MPAPEILSASNEVIPRTVEALDTLRMNIGPILPIAAIAAVTYAGIQTIVTGRLPWQKKRSPTMIA